MPTYGTALNAGGRTLTYRAGMSPVVSDSGRDVRFAPFGAAQAQGQIFTKRTFGMAPVSFRTRPIADINEVGDLRSTHNPARLPALR
jgi:hypothetical protein